MKIIVEQYLCDGNAVCVAEAPDLLALDENEQAYVLTEGFDETALERARRAVNGCPKAALRIVDEA